MFKTITYPYNHPFAEFGWELRVDGDGFTQRNRFHTLKPALAMYHEKANEHKDKKVELLQIKINYQLQFRP